MEDRSWPTNHETKVLVVMVSHSLELEIDQTNGVPRTPSTFVATSDRVIGAVAEDCG